MLGEIGGPKGGLERGATAEPELAGE